MKLDPVEVEYSRAILNAKDQEEAIYLAQGLKEYRKYYKDRDNSTPVCPHCGGELPSD